MNNEIVKHLKRTTNYGLENNGRYYSIYRGFVMDVVDPTNRNYIKVYIPSITGPAMDGKWCRPKTTVGGEGYGLQLLPKVHDPVWVEFEHGDVRFPVWSMGSSDKRKIPEAYNNKPNVIGYTTKAGQQVIIDEDNDEVKVSGKVSNLRITKKECELTNGATKIILRDDTIYIEGNSKVVVNGGKNSSVVNIDTLMADLQKLKLEFDKLGALYQAHVHEIAVSPNPKSFPTTVAYVNSVVLSTKEVLGDSNFEH